MHIIATLLFLGALGSLAAALLRSSQSLDPDVRVRRWETQPWYGSERFARWLRERPDAVKEYATLIAPYDYILVLCYGGATAFASLSSASHLQLAFLGMLAALILPGLYMAADWAENRMLTQLFSGGTAPTTMTLLKLRALTIAKLLLAVAALLQTYLIYKFV